MGIESMLSSYQNVLMKVPKLSDNLAGFIKADAVGLNPIG
jgi:hypothetical protein